MFVHTHSAVNGSISLVTIVGTDGVLLGDVGSHLTNGRILPMIKIIRHCDPHHRDLHPHGGVATGIEATLLSIECRRGCQRDNFMFREVLTFADRIDRSTVTLIYV